MIKNIVFDYGDTLIRFDMDAMVAPFVAPKDRAAVIPVLFDRLYWDRLDRGAISREELLTDAKTRLPRRLWEAATQAYDNWYYHTPEVPGMAALAHRLKAEKHMRLYLLSDISVEFAEHAAELPILSEFDGLVLSGPLGVAKPDPAIFQHLFATYGRDPAECFFIDDRRRNIEGAAAMGMRGYLFGGDVPALEAALETVLTQP